MTVIPARAPVVVGVDGSEPSLAAIDLAVRAAVERDRPLRIVHAFAGAPVDLPPGSRTGASLPGPERGVVVDGQLRDEAEGVLAQAEAYAHGRDSEVRVSADIMEGGPAAVLTAASREAALLVVGSRGRGGFAGLLLGSVAVQVSSHAACPVLVARGTLRTDGPVVAGVDGSANSVEAVAFAAQEAAQRHASLLVVYAWALPMGAGLVAVPLTYDVERLEAQQQRVLDESVAGLRDTHPDLPVESRLVRDRAANALLDLSKKARLVVVGSRGRGGFLGLLLGSTSQALIQHADCPVAVVHVKAAAEESDAH